MCVKGEESRGGTTVANAALDGAPGEGKRLRGSADDVLARDLAAAAGRRLTRLRASRAGGAGPGAAGDVDVSAVAGLDVGAAGDRLSQSYLAAELAARRPGDAVLSEEARDDPARLSAERVWIIDPLDGTREFAEPGRTDWAVHVALWERGSLTAGAVALPAQATVLSTAAAPEVPPAPAGRLRVVVSRSRPPAFAPLMAGEAGATLAPLGSAGAKAAAVIRGEAEAYVHDGGQHEWDSAAPVAVALAAGLHASRLDGSPLAYNQADPSLPDLLICRADLAGLLLEAVARARRGDGRR